MQEQNLKEGSRDPQLWMVAQRRVSFKYHLATYLVVNAFLWTLWFLGDSNRSYMWPVWPTLGWGIGLMFHFMGAYVFPRENSIEKEYEKLVREKNNLSN